MERALVDQANSQNIALIEDWTVTDAKTKLFKNLISSIDLLQRRYWR